MGKPSPHDDRVSDMNDACACRHAYWVHLFVSEHDTWRMHSRTIRCQYLADLVYCQELCCMDARPPADQYGRHLFSTFHENGSRGPKLPVIQGN